MSRGPLSHSARELPEAEEGSAQASRGEVLAGAEDGPAAGSEGVDGSAEISAAHIEPSAGHIEPGAGSAVSQIDPAEPSTRRCSRGAGGDVRPDLGSYRAGAPGPLPPRPAVATRPEARCGPGR